MPSTVVSTTSGLSSFSTCSDRGEAVGRQHRDPDHGEHREDHPGRGVGLRLDQVASERGREGGHAGEDEEQHRPPERVQGSARIAPVHRADRPYAEAGQAREQRRVAHRLQRAGDRVVLRDEEQRDHHDGQQTDGVPTGQGDDDAEHDRRRSPASPGPAPSSSWPATRSTQPSSATVSATTAAPFRTGGRVQRSPPTQRVTTSRIPVVDVRFRASSCVIVRVDRRRWRVLGLRVSRPALSRRRWDTGRAARASRTRTGHRRRTPTRVGPALGALREEPVDEEREGSPGDGTDGEHGEQQLDRRLGRQLRRLGRRGQERR